MADAELLFDLARRGKLDEVRSILDSGVAADGYFAYDGSSPMTMAARCGHVAVVELLLSRNASLDVHTDDGSSVLMQAVSGGNAAAVRLLLDARANPNEQNEDEMVPLALASEYGHLEVSRALVESKADINVSVPEWGSALDIATESGHQAVVEYLRSVGVPSGEQQSAGDRKMAAGEKWGYDAFDGEEDH